MITILEIDPNQLYRNQLYLNLYHPYIQHVIMPIMPSQIHIALSPSVIPNSGILKYTSGKER